MKMYTDDEILAVVIDAVENMDDVSVDDIQDEVIDGLTIIYTNDAKERIANYPGGVWQALEDAKATADYDIDLTDAVAVANELVYLDVYRYMGSNVEEAFRPARRASIEGEVKEEVLANLRDKQATGK